jgi:hypothetical protein
MTRAIAAIHDLVEVCRGYDPGFDSAPAFGSDLFRLSLECVPEEEIEGIAAEFGAKVHRPVDFSVEYGDHPTLRPSAHFRIGRLTIFLWAKTRKAAPDEIADAAAHINRKVESYGKPTDVHSARAVEVDTGASVSEGGMR